MRVQQVNGVKSNAAREESPPMIYGRDNIKKTSPGQQQHVGSAGFGFDFGQVHIVYVLCGVNIRLRFPLRVRYSTIQRRTYSYYVYNVKYNTVKSRGRRRACVCVARKKAGSKDAFLRRSQDCLVRLSVPIIVCYIIMCYNIEPIIVTARK